MLELCVGWSIPLPSCSSQFIWTWMWDWPVCNLLPHWVILPQPCHKSSIPGCLSPPLLLVWMNVSSLSPQLSDFHTVWFSVSSGCFLFLNLLLSFFWFCEEARCVFLCLHLGLIFIKINKPDKLLAKLSKLRMKSLINTEIKETTLNLMPQKFKTGS